MVGSVCSLVIVLSGLALLTDTVYCLVKLGWDLRISDSPDRWYGFSSTVLSGVRQTIHYEAENVVVVPAHQALANIHLSVDPAQRGSALLASDGI